MVESKGWSWGDVKNPVWLEPCEESYFYARKWMKAFCEKNKTDGLAKDAGCSAKDAASCAKDAGGSSKDTGAFAKDEVACANRGAGAEDMPSCGKKMPSVLDLGCGLGRHSILFAKEGFRVTAVDISPEAVDYLRKWEKQEHLTITSTCADIKHLPFHDDAFDYIWSYHVISHTDTEGFKQIVSELKRVVKPEGQIFLTLCSKDTWSFTEADFPKIDDNTVLKTELPGEVDVPHFFVNQDDILEYFKEFEVTSIRHVDNCYVNGKKQNNKHYFVEMNCHKQAAVFDYSDVIGTVVKGHIDRPIGSYHPRAHNIYYNINYGYIDGLFAGDNSEQDIYLLGEDKPLKEFTARVIAVWHRHNDNEDKWIVVPENCTKEFTDLEILNAIEFQEQFFDGVLYR